MTTTSPAADVVTPSDRGDEIPLGTRLSHALSPSKIGGPSRPVAEATTRWRRI